MLNPNAQKWVDALRSGEYVQGRNRLHPTDDTFCCLGVACDLYAKENPTLAQWRWSSNVFFANHESSRSSLPCAVADWLGMKRESKFGHLQNAHARYGPDSDQNLVQDNDICRFTFAEIADTIETHQKELFNT